MQWHAFATPLPDGDGPRDFWVDDSGCLVDGGLTEWSELPGSFIVHGLADAHAHPSVEPDDEGWPRARDARATLDQLDRFLAEGITIIRDVGSPGGLSLTLEPELIGPRFQAAGRFLAPPGRYLPVLLPEPAPENEVAALALAEIARGAAWVKVVGDFPVLKDGRPVAAPEANYSIETVRAICDAVHAAGARVAVHCGVENVTDLTRAGVDSIEHGVSMDEAGLESMATTGAAWTPTLCAVLGELSPEADEDQRRHRGEQVARLRELLPMAERLGVPILTGTDVVGTIVKEVRLLSECGLSPVASLRAATTSAYQFLGEEFDIPGRPTSLVTYDADPRDDPDVLSHPVAVLVDGRRVR